MELEGQLEGQLEPEELDGLLSGQTHRDVSLLLRRTCDVCDGSCDVCDGSVSSLL